MKTPLETGVETQLDIENRELTDSIIPLGPNVQCGSSYVGSIFRQVAIVMRMVARVCAAPRPRSNLYRVGGGGGSAGFENYSREQARRLVLVDANPLVNIRGTEKICRVIKDGQLFDLGKLKEPAARETMAES